MSQSEILSDGKMYNDNGFRIVDTEEIVELMAEYIFQCCHPRVNKADPTANPQDIETAKQVEESYEKYFGEPMIVKRRSSLRPPYLCGFPGQGKTQSIKTAAFIVGKALNANIILRPSDDYTPAPGNNDFVIVIHETAGEMSNTTTLGLPQKKEFVTEDGQVKEFTAKLPLKSMHNLANARFKLLMLEDFANAAVPIQNAMLSALTDNNIQGFSFGNNLAFSLSGNLGTQDGTKGISYTASITSRCMAFLVRDTLENFIERTQREFNHDMLGDGFYASFLEAKPQHFFNPDLVKSNGVPFPTSRQHDSIVDACRVAVGQFQSEQRKGVEHPYIKPLKYLELSASGLGGKDLAEDLKSFFTCLFHYRAAPLAQSFMTEQAFLCDNDKNKNIIDEINTRMGDGINVDQVTFVGRFINVCVDYAARMFLNGEQQKAMQGMCYLMFGVPDPQNAQQPKLVLPSDEVERAFTQFLKRVAYGLGDEKQVYFDKRIQKAIVHQDLAMDWLNKTFSQHPYSAVAAANTSKSQLEHYFIDVLGNRRYDADHVASSVSESDVDMVEQAMMHLVSQKQMEAAQAQEQSAQGQQLTPPVVNW